MSEQYISINLAAPVQGGETVTLCLSGVGVPVACATTDDPLPELRAGDRLAADMGSFVVCAATWVARAQGGASLLGYVLRAQADIAAGSALYLRSRPGYALAWITLSDKGAAGKRSDESGPLIETMVAEHLELAYGQGFMIPDEARRLKGLVTDLALNQGFDLILTTGGTGVGPRDITPEATLAVIEKRLPGYERAMTAVSLAKTPHGAISRAVAGTLGQALIVNMPGSPKAVAECLSPLLPTLKHTLEKLQGDPSDCAQLHK